LNQALLFEFHPAGPLGIARQPEGELNLGIGRAAFAPFPDEVKYPLAQIPAFAGFRGFGRIKQRGFVHG
jgi:hypothetical protein